MVGTWGNTANCLIFLLGGILSTLPLSCLPPPVSFSPFSKEFMPGTNFGYATVPTALCTLISLWHAGEIHRFNVEPVLVDGEEKQGGAAGADGGGSVGGGGAEDSSGGRAGLVRRPRVEWAREDVHSALEQHWLYLERLLGKIMIILGTTHGRGESLSSEQMKAISKAIFTVTASPLDQVSVMSQMRDRSNLVNNAIIKAKQSQLSKALGEKDRGVVSFRPSDERYRLKYQRGVEPPRPVFYRQRTGEPDAATKEGGDHDCGDPKCPLSILECMIAQDEDAAEGRRQATEEDTKRTNAWRNMLDARRAVLDAEEGSAERQRLEVGYTNLDMEYTKLTTTVSVEEIFFTQSTCAASFKDGGDSLESLIGELQAGKTSVAAIRPIRVVEFQGRLHSLDNRRLYVLKEFLKDKAVKTVRVVMKEYRTVKDEFDLKFTSENPRVIEVRKHDVLLEGNPYILAVQSGTWTLDELRTHEWTTRTEMECAKHELGCEEASMYSNDLKLYGAAIGHLEQCGFFF